MSFAVNFVKDAATLAPAVIYEPENIELDHFTFLPWVRTGLAAQIAGPPVKLRAGVAPAINVTDANGTVVVKPPTPIALIGPGDVVGIDPAQIVRRYPAPGAINVDPSYLAHVEFDRPEFPWVFTPFAPAGDRLDPWLALIVIPTDQLPRPSPSAGRPAFVDVARRHLQPLDDRWAWAHAQVSGLPNASPSVKDRLTDSYGPVNLSRLLCPRKLEPSRMHLACVVPAYECGVHAGLGKPEGTLAPAWTRTPGDDNDMVRLPVYAYWQFTTGPESANFEALAKKLHGAVAPWRVGRRIIDASQPAGGVTLQDTDGERQLFECALKSPQPVPPEDAATLGTWSTATRDLLRKRLNVGPPIDPEAEPDPLPQVAPRIYAQYQRGERTVGAVSDTDWFEQLNTSPMDRIASGLGTRVVQKDQEALMQAAWAQVGELEAANRTVVRAQFARYAAEALHRNHLSRLDLGGVAHITRAVHGKVRLGGHAFTIAGTAARSATPPAALTGAFRRMTRVRGPISRVASRVQGRATTETRLRTLIADDLTFRDLRREHVVAEGIRGLSDEAISRFPKEHLGLVVDATPENAAAAFASAIAPLKAGLTSADLVQQPVEQWRVREGTIDLGAIGAGRVVDTIERALERPDKLDAAHAESLGQLAAGIVSADFGRTSARARAVLGRVSQRLGEFSAPGVWHSTRASRDVLTTGPDAGILRGAQPGGRPADGVTLESRLTTGVSIAVATELAAVREVPRSRVAREFHDALRGGAVQNLPALPDLPRLSLDRTSLLAALHPQRTVTRYVSGRIQARPKWLPADWFDDGRVRPIMAAPTFVRAMYEALDAYDRGWLIPGLGEVDETDFVTVVQTNPRFTEAFLIGLSDEFGRELLWRGYPTDARGTYFRRFWNSAVDELSGDIHAFANTALSTHVTGAASGVAVLCIRGELIRHYPDALIFAVQRIGTDEKGRPVFAAPPAPFGGASGAVLFHAVLPPDIVLVGFNLPVDQIRAQNTPWWFVIAEHPTEPRFGLDTGPGLSGNVNKDDLTWNTLGLRAGTFLSTQQAVTVVEPVGGESTQWGPATLTGAGAARVLLQNPFRAAWHASKLVTPAKG